MRTKNDDRIHTICELLTEGKTTEEICQTVPHPDFDDTTFTSLIIALRCRRIRTDISDAYDFKGYKTIVEIRDAFFDLRPQIAKLINQGVDNKTIVKELFDVSCGRRETDFAIYVTNYRRAYTNRNDFELKHKRRKGLLPSFNPTPSAIQD